MKQPEREKKQQYQDSNKLLPEATVRNKSGFPFITTRGSVTCVSVAASISGALGR